MHTLSLRSTNGHNQALDAQVVLHQQNAKKRETIKKCEAKEKPKIMRNFARQVTKYHTHTARGMSPNATPHT